MPDQYASAVYHLAQPGQLPPGQLVHVEDSPGGTANIYLHRFHVRQTLVWELNWLTRHQVGNGLWQQNWTNDGRMQDPPQGLAVATSRWEFVPTSAMPTGMNLMAVASEGSCIWLVRASQCTHELRDAMNLMLERIAGDGLWLQRWYEHYRRPPVPPQRPPLAPPTASLLR